MIPFSKALIEYLAVGVEIAAAAVIGIAAVEATLRSLWSFTQTPARRQINGVRLSLGRWLALGLEFTLAADILRTAVAPTWDDIGKLAAIAVLRTALNFFLEREIRREQPDATN